MGFISVLSGALFRENSRVTKYWAVCLDSPKLLRNSTDICSVMLCHCLSCNPPVCIWCGGVNPLLSVLKRCVNPLLSTAPVWYDGVNPLLSVLHQSDAVVLTLSCLYCTSLTRWMELAWRSGIVMDCHATAWGSIPGGNVVFTKLHVLRKGQ